MQTGELEALPALRLGIRDHRAGGTRKNTVQRTQVETPPQARM